MVRLQEVGGDNRASHRNVDELSYSLFTSTFHSEAAVDSL